MGTIAMDTYGLIADGVAAAGGGVTGAIRPSRCRDRGQTTAGGGFPARRGQANDGGMSPLRTPVRRAIIILIAHLSPVQIAFESAPRRSIP